MNQEMTNYEIRRKAAQILKGFMGPALLVGLIAMIPSLISQVVSVLMGGSLIDRMYSFIDTFSASQMPTAADLGRFWSTLDTQAILIVLLFQLGAQLLTPALALGQKRFTLKLARGSELADLSTITEMLPYALKGIGLFLLTTLKVLLRMLPGLGLALVFELLALFTGIDFLLTLAMGCIYFVALPMGIAASCRYYLASYVLADHPETGLRACIARSSEISGIRTLRIFAMLMFYMMMTLVAVMVGEMLVPLFGSVVASTISMVLQLAVTVLECAAFTVFYLQFIPDKKNGEAKTAEEAEET